MEKGGDDAIVNAQELEEGAQIHTVKIKPFHLSNIMSPRPRMDGVSSYDPSQVSTPLLEQKPGEKKHKVNNLGDHHAGSGPPTPKLLTPHTLEPPSILSVVFSKNFSPRTKESVTGDQLEVNCSGFSSEDDLGNTSENRFWRSNTGPDGKSFGESRNGTYRNMSIMSPKSNFSLTQSFINSPYSSEVFQGGKKKKVRNIGGLPGQNIARTEVVPFKEEDEEGMGMDDFDLKNIETFSDEEDTKTQADTVTRGNLPTFNRQRMKTMNNDGSVSVSVAEGFKRPNVDFSKLNSKLNGESETFRAPRENILNSAAGSYRSKLSTYRNMGTNRNKSNPLASIPADMSSYDALIKAIFAHDVILVQAIVDHKTDLQINEIDCLGNTPLMLACKLSYRHLEYFEIIQILLEKGADPRIRDGSGWSCIDEAVGQSDAMLLSLLLDHLMILKQQVIREQQENMIKVLNSMPDFYLEMKWDFESSLVPFISKIAPSDTFKIWKYGNYLRMDNTLVGFKKFKSKRRNMSLIFNPNIEMSKEFETCASLYSLNRTKKIYTNLMQAIDLEEKKHMMCDLMRANPLQGSFNIKDVHWNEPKGFFGNNLRYKIGEFETRRFDYKITMEYAVYKKSQAFFKDTYEMYRDTVATINQEETENCATQKSSKAILAHLKERNGLKKEEITEEKEAQDRVHTTGASYQRTVQADTFENTQVSEKKGGASIWFTEDFPLKLKDLLQTIQFLSKGNDLLQKMESLLSREEIKTMNSDNAFPMKLQLPVTLSIKANITITKFEHLNNIDTEDIFFVPKDFNYLSRKEAQKTPQRIKKRMLLINILT